MVERAPRHVAGFIERVGFPAAVATALLVMLGVAMFKVWPEVWARETGRIVETMMRGFSEQTNLAIKHQEEHYRYWTPIINGNTEMLKEIREAVRRNR